MSLELETGIYIISSVSFATGQPVTRFLGASQEHEGAIVVLPPGSPPHLWLITKLHDNIYTINFNGRFANIANGSLKLTDSRIAPTEWLVIRGAPSPPPVGRNSYGIIAPGRQPQESWFIGSTEGDVEVPVTIGNVASSIVIVSPLRE